MSKKVVAFALPLKAARPEPNKAAEPDPSPEQGADGWVHAPHDAEPVPQAAVAANRVVIDLSAQRNMFELMQLICVFPYLATSCWMENAAKAWTGSFKPR